MFAELNGIIAEIAEDHIVLRVGGIGYKVNLHAQSLEKFSSLGQDIRLAIITKFKVDKIILYGFWTSFQKTAFEIISDISGVPDRGAQAMVQALTQEQIWHLVLEDGKNAPKIGGLGSKTWSKIAFHLKSHEAFRLLCLAASNEKDGRSTKTGLHLRTDTILALEAMGLGKTHAATLTDRALDLGGEFVNTGELVKVALELWTRA